MRTRQIEVVLVVAVAIAAAAALPRRLAGQADPSIAYTVSFPEPEHHWLQVEARFTGLGTAPLRARMSRSSPGRYAVHEFAKNVSNVEAFDAGGRRLRVVRPDVDEWRVDDHGGSVRLVYRVFGDQADGTYLAVDTTHAHLNMPAVFMWAVGFDDRSLAIRFEPPPNSRWTVGTQLFPTADPFTFTAPNLQYLMDSPTELAALKESFFAIPDGGRQVRFRLLAHTAADHSDLDALAVLVERLVREARAVFGEFPDFEPGHYTFLLDYTPWVDDDAMEHRNSTYISDSSASLTTPSGRLRALDAIAHEFFHVWNVERIRPAGLEPFDFTRQNITCCLWLAEGFTQYYGPLILRRAGLSTVLPVGAVPAVMTSTAGLVRSAVEMSEHGPFADAGVANDADDRARTYISYYTHGAALALALDLSIRERSNGQRSLDDFMRRLWERYGRATGSRPGDVPRPYTLSDLRRELGEVVGDAGFADGFFDRHIEGRETADYQRLLGLAGFSVGRRAPDRGWIGNVAVQEAGNGLLVGGERKTGPGSVTALDTPAYRAGLDRGDVIVEIDGVPATVASWNAIGDRRPDDRVSLTIARRDGTRQVLTAALVSDPSVQIRPAEAAGLLTPAQRAFRQAWLETRIR